MTPDVQILNDPVYQRLRVYEARLNDMITNLEYVYSCPIIDGQLTKGIETHLRISVVSVRNALKQMRGETL